MKVYMLILSVLFIACNQASEKNKSSEQTAQQDSTVQTLQEESESTDEVHKALMEHLSDKDFLDCFKDFTTNVFDVQVEPYMHERTIESWECIPSKYGNYFKGFIPIESEKSTGIKPVGKLLIQKGKYFLVIVQQADYGPVYYGLAYDKIKDKIISNEIIAEEWKDAGYLQNIYSKIKSAKNEIVITKIIQTCHADLEESGEEMIGRHTECKDSSKVVVFGHDMKIKK